MHAVTYSMHALIQAETTDDCLFRFQLATKHEQLILHRMEKKSVCLDSMVVSSGFSVSISVGGLAMQ